MLRDSVVVVVVVVRKRPWAIPLAMITMRKSIQVSFSFLYEYVPRLTALRVAGAPLLVFFTKNEKCIVRDTFFPLCLQR